MIFGGHKLKQNFAMLRGIKLEEKVKEVVEKMLKLKFRTSGLYLHEDHPIFRASPDGVSSNGFCLEIK